VKPKTAFTEAEIDKIANLAQIELSAGEKATFGRQFGEILSYFQKIEEVDVSAADAALDQQTPQPKLREDRATPSGISPADFSPYLEDGHYKVPKVIE
jgi:aspartyl-tRNA(Asn)/glutamyl-tRNA(Gln) amidotransferase subunit C